MDKRECTVCLTSLMFAVSHMLTHALTLSSPQLQHDRHTSASGPWSELQCAALKPQTHTCTENREHIPMGAGQRAWPDKSTDQQTVHRQLAPYIPLHNLRLLLPASHNEFHPPGQGIPQRVCAVPQRATPLGTHSAGSHPPCGVDAPGTALGLALTFLTGALGLPHCPLPPWPSVWEGVRLCHIL